MARGRAVRGTQNGTQRARQTETPEASQEEERSAQESGDDGVVGNSTEKYAADLVRLAIFSETRRATFKRDDINKKVFGQSGATGFAAVWKRAQETLNDVFGMEMIEVPSRAERDAAERVEDKGKAVAAAKKKQTSSTKTWMVRSILDPQIIAAANAADEDILNKERSRPPPVAPVVRDEFDEASTNSDGSIISWCISDQLGSMGLLGVILSLILVNEKEVSDKQLRGYLKTLKITPEHPLPFKGASGVNKKTTLEDQLASYIKGGYLEKLKVANPMAGPNATQQANKRGRGKTTSDDPDAQYTWKWGGRAHAEIGEAAVVEFMTSLMVDRNSVLDEDEEEAVVAERKSKEAGEMRKSIMKAAGGRLFDESD